MLVIGNGESRNAINIDLFPGRKVGCNAIVRDYKVDYLVCVDHRMIDEVTKNHSHNYECLYTRPDRFVERKNRKNVRSVPDVPFSVMGNKCLVNNWGSGELALLIAALTERDIAMIGFDLYYKYTPSGIIPNNVYRGTENYGKEECKVEDPRRMIQVIGSMLEYFKECSFTIYQKENWELPQEWDHANVKVLLISKLVHMINASPVLRKAKRYGQ